jgi:uncharacterized lipoprotein YmbA
MKSLRGLCCCAAAAALLAACVAGHPDRFYALTTLPEASGAVAPARVAPSGAASGAFTTHVILIVSLPAVIDRREMVINTSADRLLVLEHERWAAPMSELVAQTLARDLEQRRADILVADRSFDQSSIKQVKVRVDVVQMSVREGGQATLEAHWRIVDATHNIDELGGETFQHPVGSPGGDDAYAGIARAFSNDLSSLADRLAGKLPGP